MRYFILFAHPDPVRSFNAAMLRRAAERLAADGHEIVVSDLYAMNFNPVASARDCSERRFPDRLQYDREQKFSVARSIVAPDIAAELEKLLWCNMLVMQFPLYWFSMPAIMKGWVDRVFLNTVVYGAGKRYETGGLKGRRAMVATTTGAYESMFQPDGLLGDLNRALWHIHNGMLHYTGMTVLPPYVGWSPVPSDQAATDALIDGYVQRLLDADQTEPMRFHPTTDFGNDYRMKPGTEPVSDGHWRR